MKQRLELELDMMTNDDEHTDQQVDHLLIILRQEFWGEPLPEGIQRLAEQLRLRLQAAHQDRPEE